MSKQRSSSRHRAPLARYANYFEVGHNAFEFLLDFGQYQPDAEAIVLHTRMALGPTHAKLLARMLEKAVTAHETSNGPIAEPSDPLDPLEVVLRSLPDFERRAVNARRDGAVLRAATPGGRATTKR
jgi:hypothetical protein